jgi:peptidoglycan/LPS O-acetylase OafA/YrhL
VNANASPAGRDNAFDLIRLMLAVLVVYGHACLVGGFGDEGFANFCKMQTTAGPFAVTGFFGISGFLVTRSFAMRDSWIQFTKARLLRILPGFYFALVVTAFCLAPLIAGHNPAARPWDASSAFGYVWRNASVRILSPRIGDILQGMPSADALNSSLWTLFPELCCYGLVLVMGVLGMIRSSRANVLLMCAAVLALHAAIVIGPRGFIIAPTILQLTGDSPYVVAFLVGSAAYCYRDVVIGGTTTWIAWMAAAVMLLSLGGWALLGPVAFTLALIQAAHSFRVSLPVDLSYGTYLLHFPVLQLLASLGLNQHGFTAYLATALLVTGALATLSWCAIERPFIRLKG